MFIRAGNYTINTDSIAHIFHYEDTGTIQIKFVGGEAVELKSTDASGFLNQLSGQSD